MEIDLVIRELNNNKEVFKNLLSGLPATLYLWKPAPEKWCLLQIICHLYDEEREDFRARVKHVLETPQELMPKINPQAWASERAYMEQDYERMIVEFTEERQTSVHWLRSLENPKWDNCYMHPDRGALPATLFFKNWLAHDILHIRQIIRLKYAYLKETGGVPLDYAGEW